MKKIVCLLLLFILVLTGCSKEITEKDLTNGHWVGTAAYEDGEIKGDSKCDPFDRGIEFKDEDTVHVDAFGEDFTYRLKETDDGTDIEFYDSNGVIYFYDLNMIDSDKIGLNGQGIQEEESCYLERK